MANGRVATGYSLPIVAKYENNDGNVTYTGAMPLARGVSVSLEPEYTEGDPFFADNMIAEDVPGQLTGGTVTLTVDGLLTAATKFVYGIEAADGADWLDFNDDVNIPYVGIGYVVEYMSGGVRSYVPYVITKCRANYAGQEFNTREDEIEWQTAEIEFNLYRDDTDKHAWKKDGKEYSTEDDAKTAIMNFFGSVVPDPGE